MHEIHEIGADWFTVRAGHGKLSLLGGVGRQRKGKKVTEFFLPRKGATSLQHFLHGQTLLRGDKHRSLFNAHPTS